MTKIITILFTISISSFMFCQTPTNIDEKIDSLKLVQSTLSQELKTVSEELENLEYLKLKRLKEARMSQGVEIFSRHNATLYAGRGTWHKEITSIPPNTTLLAYEYESNYYLVSYDTLTGYVFSSDIETINQRTKRQKDEKEKYEEKLLQEKEAYKAKQLRIQREKERKQRLIAKYGEERGNDIVNERIWLGMSREMVIESWGKPKDINKSVGSWGVHEQFIYNSSYLYIDNGILTSWQN